jgi:hypothetical protein
MKSNPVSAWGPIHNDQIGIPHNVDDDADSLAVSLSHMISDFETAAHPSLQPNSISVRSSDRLSTKAKVEDGKSVTTAKPTPTS